VQRIIDSDIYRLIFPKVNLSGKRTVTATDSNWLRNGDEFEIVDRRGYYKCAGVGGGITGSGFHTGIVDDPYKDQKEADSATVSNATWEWYTSTFLTREEKDGRIILTLTRWNLHDLAARLLDQEAEEWEVLSLPAIAEGDLHPEDPRKPGEALWPEKMSIDALMKRKKTMPQSQWEALYQQRPVPKGGSMFKPREWIKPENWVKALPVGIKTAWYWDNAGTQDGGANSAGFLGGFHEGRFYMIKSVAGQWSSANREARKRAEAEWARDKFRTTTIFNEQEPGSAGKEQFENTSRNLAGFAAKADKVTGSKESRADTLAAQMEVGNVYVYAPEGEDNSWINDLFDELESFPKGKRKDRVDSATGCYNMLANEKRKGRIHT
jgi:predicted phage terminase large subunit-like protein